MPVLLEEGDEGAVGPCEWSQMSFGNYHSVGVTRTGEVFTWGRGNYGSLGHGNDDTIMKPKQVKSLMGNTVTHVACGSYHTAVVTREGELFTW